eukprot:356279-Heterocapsa_arctica.AAC.1
MRARSGVPPLLLFACLSPPRGSAGFRARLGLRATLDQFGPQPFWFQGSRKAGTPSLEAGHGPWKPGPLAWRRGGQ